MPQLVIAKKHVKDFEDDTCLIPVECVTVNKYEQTQGEPDYARFGLDGGGISVKLLATSPGEVYFSPFCSV